MPASFVSRKRHRSLDSACAQSSTQTGARHSVFRSKLSGGSSRMSPSSRHSADMGAIAERLDEQYSQAGRLRREPCPAARTGDRQSPTGAAGFARRRRFRVADRLRQCRQPAACARGGARKRDRHSHGAWRERGRIVRQLLTESALLAIVGGGVGLLLAVLGLKALDSAQSGRHSSPRSNHIDGRVLAFTFAVSLLTGSFSDSCPRLQASKPDLNETLKEGGRERDGRRRGRRIRSLLVVSEIALSLVLA